MYLREPTEREVIEAQSQLYEDLLRGDFSEVAECYADTTEHLKEMMIQAMVDNDLMEIGRIHQQITAHLWADLYEDAVTKAANWIEYGERV